MNFYLLWSKAIRHSIKISRVGRSNMELLHVISTQLRLLTKRNWVIFTPLLLAACATASPELGQQAEKEGEEAPVVMVDGAESVTAVDGASEEKVAEPVEPEKPQIPLNAELMYYILTAEVAGQRGQMGIAVDLYSKAADLVDSTTLAGRSAQVATYTRDKNRIEKALKRWLEVEPDNADVYIMKAPIAMLNKHFDEALEASNKALSLQPEHAAEYLATMADSLRELAEAKQGLGFIQSLDAYQQNNPEAFYASARLAMLYKRYEDALVEVNKVLSVEPNRQDAILIKAEALQRVGKGNESTALLKKTIAKGNADEELKFAYAKSLGENGETAQAQAMFEELHQLAPENNEYIFALGLIALEVEQGEAAKKYFNTLIQNGDPGKQAAYFMGLAEQLNKNIDQALVWFASVPPESGRYDSAQTNYIAILGEQGEIDKARNHLKLLRKEQPKRAVDFYLYEAAFLREHDLNQQAFELYNEAIIQHPDNMELLYARAMVAEPLNRLSVLEEDLRFILDKDPDNAQALNALGYTLADRTNRYDEALVLIQKAVDLSPKDPYFLDSLGWVYYRLGDLEKAEHYLREAIVMQEDVEFMAHLGEVLWEQNRQKEAKKIWSEAKKIAADNKNLVDTMSRYGQ